MNSNQQKWLLIILIVIVLNAGIWFLGIVPSRTAIAEVQKQTASAEQKAAQLQQRLKSLETIDIEALEEEKLEQLIRVPDVGYLREMMTELEAKSIETKNEIFNMNFTYGTMVGQYQLMEISISMGGDYFSLYSYINYLETHSRLIIIDSFSLGGSGDDLSATLKIFMFAEDFDTYTPYLAPGRANPFALR